MSKPVTTQVIKNSEGTNKLSKVKPAIHIEPIKLFKNAPEPEITQDEELLDIGEGESMGDLDGGFTNPLEGNNERKIKHYFYSDGGFSAMYTGADPESAAKRAFKAINIRQKRGQDKSQVLNMDVNLRRIEDGKDFIVNVQRIPLQKPVTAPMKTKKKRNS